MPVKVKCKRCGKTPDMPFHTCKNKAAVALGRIKSKAKAKAARENGKLGGRPKKQRTNFRDIEQTPGK